MKKTAPFVPKILFRISVWINAARPLLTGVTMQVQSCKLVVNLFVCGRLCQMFRMSLPLMLLTLRQNK